MDYEYIYKSPDSDEIEIIYWGTLVLLFLGLIFLIYYIKCISRPMRILNYLAINHLSSSYLHIVCIAVYNLFEDDEDVTSVADTIIYSTYSTLDLLITFSTASLSLCSIIRIFIPELAELYTKRDMAYVSAFCLTVMELYEFLFGFIYKDFDDNVVLQSSLRITTVTLIMSATFFILVCLIITAFFNSAIRSSLCSIFIVHISVYLVSDVLFILYSFYTKSYLGAVFSIILLSRLVVEMAWFIIYNCLFGDYIFVAEGDLSTPESREQNWRDEDDELSVNENGNNIGFVLTDTEVHRLENENNPKSSKASKCCSMIICC